MELGYSFAPPPFGRFAILGGLWFLNISSFSHKVIGIFEAFLNLKIALTLTIQKVGVNVGF
jgi:hypothetical protein